MADYLEFESNTDNLLLESGIGDKLVLETGLVGIFKNWLKRNFKIMAIIEEEEWL